MEILVAAINVIWLWLCLAPVLLILAIFLIKLAKNSDVSLSPLPHKKLESIKTNKNTNDPEDINDRLWPGFCFECGKGTLFKWIGLGAGKTWECVKCNKYTT